MHHINLFIFTVLSILTSLAGFSTARAQHDGVRFRDMVGVNARNGISGSGNLAEKAIGHGRADLSWGDVEPSEGNFDESAIDDWANNVVGSNDARNVTTLPSFSYGAPWAADYRSTSFKFTNHSYEVTNVGDQEARYSGGRVNNRLIDAGTEVDKLPIHPGHVPDWKNYVKKATTLLVNEYGVEYFQIWNEPNPSRASTWGDMDLSADELDSQGDGFFTRVHKPASEAIRQAGGKVVFGGWPLGETVGAFADYKDLSRPSSVSVYAANQSGLEFCGRDDGGARRAADLGVASATRRGGELGRPATPVRTLPMYQNTGAGRRPWDAVGLIEGLRCLS